MKNILHVVTEKQFVAKYFLVAVKNGLARHITQLNTLWGFTGMCGRRGFRHTSDIGRIGEHSSAGKHM
jgi:hypothetical protein